MVELAENEDRVNLRRVERELDRIFSSLGHGMYVVDRDRRVLLWNRAAQSILGWSEEEVLGKNCKDFIGHLDDSGHQLCDDRCPLTASMGGSHTVFAGTVWGKSKSGDLVPLNVSCAPLLDDNSQMVGAVEVFADMTEEKELERFKSEMTSVVAHELRTPLTSMKGYLEMVLDGEVGEVTVGQKKFLEIVSSNIDKLTDLVNDFLDLEKLESGHFVVHWEEVDVISVIDELLETFGPMAENKSLDLKTSHEDIGAIQGDRKLVGQLLGNLISNAIKYTNEGQVSVRVFEEGDAVVVEVEDTGVGIPEDELGKLTGRFFRASSASQTTSTGSGLGLSISSRILEVLKGSLDIHSVHGKGSRFTARLPLVVESTILGDFREV